MLTEGVARIVQLLLDFDVENVACLREFARRERPGMA